MLYLKQSTSVVVSFGPFVDKTDGVALETGLVSSLDHGTTGIFLSKNGGALTIRHATVTASTYDAYGCYRVTLDTTDTGTVGTLRMAFSEAATCLPVWQDFMVLPANVYDSLMGTDYLDVSAVQFSGQTISASGGVTVPAATLASTTNITAASGCTLANGAHTITSLTATAGITVTQSASNQPGMQITGNGTGHGLIVTSGSGATGDGLRAVAASTNGNGITGVKAGSGSDLNATVTPLTLAKTTNITGFNDIAATAIVSSGAITTSGGAVSTVTSVSNDVNVADADVRGAIGLASANLDTQLSTISTYIDTEVASILAAVDTEIADIKAKTDNLPASPAAVSDCITAAGVRTAVGLASANLDTQLSGINSKTTNLPASPAATGDCITAAGVRTAVGLASANLDTQLSAIDDYLDTEVAAIKAATDQFVFTVPNRVDATATIAAADIRSAVGLASANLDTQLGDLPTATENADALLNRDMSAVTDSTARSPLNALRKLMNKWSISGGTLTVKKENDVTTAYTQTLTTDAAAEPITGVDTD